MSAAGTPSTDPWVVVSRERARYEEQFRSLKPINGIVTGDQAKAFLLQSQLPPLVLGQIWALADTDADGKMDINEFSIACKLINLKLRGFEIPKMLPPSLLASLTVYKPPAIPPLPTVMPQSVAPQLIKPPMPPQPVIAPPPLIPPQALVSQSQPLVPNLSSNLISQPAAVAAVQPPIPALNQIGPIIPPQVPLSQGFVPSQPIVPLAPIAPSVIPGGVPMVPVNPAVPASGTVLALMSPVTGAPMLPPGTGPVASSTPRTSVTSLTRVASVDSPLVDWAVPHHIKLKYTQIFNTTDRSRTGFLSGPQARNVMVQTKLPQNLLAQIWALSDMDADGRLGCEEFVLAMHLCEQASTGVLPPAVLPPDLIPPSFRRGPRTNSISSQGSAPPDQDPASTLLASSFEDKRKENFEKGQAELERRRKTIMEQQRKEAEERERKERDEMERREKARQEAERRRIDELEKQMREQQEQERLKDEERKRQADQREAARREMERQRQLEWEKQRSQELQQQRQREQENVLRLKAKNQTLTIELSSLNEQIKELSQKICDTRVGVSNVKTTIDGMRSTRDSQMQDMSQLKNKLKEQNAKLLALTQEKAKLDAKNKLNAQLNDQQDQHARQAYENKEITIKNLKEKIEDMQKQIDGKMGDIENNNSQLDELKAQMSQLVRECQELYGKYEEKRDKVLDMKSSSRNVDYASAWKNTDDWGNGDADADSAWPVDNWATTSAPPDAKTPEQPEKITAAVMRYRALYEFVARNADEVSFQPGDIIHVPLEQTGEPGWLAGEIRGHTGWFPESYVEPVDGVGIRGLAQTIEVMEVIEAQVVEEAENKRLEGIAEVPETIIEPVTAETPNKALPDTEPIEFCIANYPYQSVEQGDLNFNAGEVIAVLKKDGDWWTGKNGDNIGIFPSNYVQKYDPNSVPNTVNANAPPAMPPAAVPVPQQDASTAQTDNEVSQLTDNKITDRPIDFANAQPQLHFASRP